MFFFSGGGCVLPLCACLGCMIWMGQFFDDFEGELGKSRGLNRPKNTRTAPLNFGGGFNVTH